MALAEIADVELESIGLCSLLEEFEEEGKEPEMNAVFYALRERLEDMDATLDFLFGTRIEPDETRTKARWSEFWLILDKQGLPMYVLEWWVEADWRDGEVMGPALAVAVRNVYRDIAVEIA